MKPVPEVKKQLKVHLIILPEEWTNMESRNTSNCGITSLTHEYEITNQISSFRCKHDALVSTWHLHKSLY